MKWIGVMAALLLSVSCFTPWVIFQSRNIIVSGIDAGGTNFGKPGYLHFVFTAVFIILSFIQKTGAKRINVPIAAINLAWAIRNYFVLTACSAGECPQTQTGLWLVLFASGLMMVSALFPDIAIIKNKTAD